MATGLQEQNIGNHVFVISYIIFSNTHSNPCEFVMVALILQMMKLKLKEVSLRRSHMSQWKNYDFNGGLWL